MVNRFRNHRTRSVILVVMERRLPLQQVVRTQSVVRRPLYAVEGSQQSSFAHNWHIESELNM